jgi:hypothetical protein
MVCTEARGLYELTGLPPEFCMRLCAIPSAKERLERIYAVRRFIELLPEDIGDEKPFSPLYFEVFRVEFGRVMSGESAEVVASGIPRPE